MTYSSQTPSDRSSSRAARDEGGRLAALRRLKLLDSAPSESFDRVTRLAAQALKVPIALVSVIDETRQWCKSWYGIGAVEAPREMSFCGHAVRGHEPLIVPDASLDPRFADNPLVTGAAHIRAYLGIPLLTREGHAIGTLCAMDTQSRELDEQDVSRLRDYAKILEASIHAMESAAHTEALLDEVRRMRAMTNSAPALIGYWNRNLICEFANERHHQVFELQPTQVIGSSLATLLGEPSFARWEPHVRRVLEGHTERFERTHKKADGSTVRLDIQYVPDIHANLEVPGFFAFAIDVTASRAERHALESANSKLASDSSTDYLTGLPNRRVFSERSESAWKRFKKSGEVCGLILLDLDNFKRVNDDHGHSAGDDVLRRVGALLKAQLRGPRDIAARLGGEEFAVLCFGEMDEELMLQIAERLRTRIARESVDSGTQLFDFTASFGLAISHGGDFGWKDIYTRADAALYQAKAAGKNQVQFGAVKSAPPQCAKALPTLLSSLPAD